jgi:hypothetical protein
MRSLNPAPGGIPHEFVQLQLEPHGQLVGHDALGQPGGVQAAPDGAEEDVEGLQDAVRFAPTLGPQVVRLVAQDEFQLILTRTR